LKLKDGPGVGSGGAGKREARILWGGGKKDIPQRGAVARARNMEAETKGTQKREAAEGFEGNQTLLLTN